MSAAGEGGEATVHLHPLPSRTATKATKTGGCFGAYVGLGGGGARCEPRRSGRLLALKPVVVWLLAGGVAGYRARSSLAMLLQKECFVVSL